MPSRRQFLSSSTALIAYAAFGRSRLAAQAPAGSGTFQDLREGVGLFTGKGGTIGWLISRDGLLVVDSQYPDTAAICLAGLQERSKHPILALVNTHYHGDHTGGNAVFKAAAKTIVAHVNVPEWQKKAAGASGGAEPVCADTTFDKTWSLTIGKERVTATHYGPGHTNGDAVVYFERANVAHMGDLMFNRLHPFIDRPAGASIANWIKTIETVTGTLPGDTVYIFGHGKPGFGVTGTRTDLLVQRDYLTAVLETARKTIAGGGTRESLEKTETLPGFPDHAIIMPKMSLGAVLGVAYDELQATKSGL